MEDPRACYLRTPAAAQYLGVSKSFLEKRRVAGDGPEYHALGKAIVYSRNALDEFAQHRRRRSTSETVPHHSVIRGAKIRPPPPGA